MDVKTTTLRVTGMHCSSCTSRVERALEALDGCDEVTIELATGLVDVRHDGLDPAALVAAVREAGYEAEVRA
jgi:Cu+-exporting ATPase